MLSLKKNSGSLPVILRFFQIFFSELKNWVIFGIRSGRYNYELNVIIFEYFWIFRVLNFLENAVLLNF